MRLQCKYRTHFIAFYKYFFPTHSPEDFLFLSHFYQEYFIQFWIPLSTDSKNRRPASDPMILRWFLLKNGSQKDREQKCVLPWHFSGTFILLLFYCSFKVTGCLLCLSLGFWWHFFIQYHEYWGCLSPHVPYNINGLVFLQKYERKLIWHCGMNHHPSCYISDPNANMSVAFILTNILMLENKTCYLEGAVKWVSKLPGRNL